MPSSELKALTNRKNARLSTGPKTRNGKNRTRLNALKHGIYATPLCLPAESRRLHRHLIERLQNKWQPDGPEEELLFGEIVRVMLEIKRLTRGYDAHLWREICRRALLREHNDAISTADSPDTQTRRSLTKPATRPKRQDLDDVLIAVLHEPRDIRIADHVDRRRRQLVQHLVDSQSALRDLQNERRAVTVISETNSLERETRTAANPLPDVHRSQQTKPTPRTPRQIRTPQTKSAALNNVIRPPKEWPD